MDDPSAETQTTATVSLTSAWRGAANAIAAPIVLVALIAAGQFVFSANKTRTPPPERPGDRAAQVQNRIDPNTAPLWELTILPGVGEATARAIIEHRRQALDSGKEPRPFKVASDLENVHGIGPKTVERFKSLLRFAPETTEVAAPNS